MKYFRRNGLFNILSFLRKYSKKTFFFLSLSRHILQADSQRECNHWMECIEKTINNALNNSISNNQNENENNDQLSNHDQLNNSSFNEGDNNENSSNSFVSNGGFNNFTLFIKPDLSSSQLLNDSNFQDSFLSTSNISKHKRTLSQK